MDAARAKSACSQMAEMREDRMKKALWLVGGFCAAAAGFLVLGAKRTPAVEELAEALEAAWEDHHTVV